MERKKITPGGDGERGGGDIDADDSSACAVTSSSLYTLEPQGDSTQLQLKMSAVLNRRLGGRPCTAGTGRLRYTTPAW